MFTDRNFDLVPRSAVAMVSLVAFFLVSLLSVGPLHAQQDQVDVAVVYHGTPGVHLWLQAHDNGIEYMEEQLGDQVEVTVVEDIPAVDVGTVFEDLASEHDIVFGATFEYQWPMEEVAPSFPDTAFMNATGFLMGENMGNYLIRFHGASFLAGIVAAHHVDEGFIGYVAPHPIPDALGQINAFALGVQEIDPDREVRVVFSDAWADPAADREAAQGLIDVGAELIAQFTASAGPVLAAEDNGIPSIGFHVDLSDEGPNTNLTSVHPKWGPFYVQEVQSVIDGTWEPRSFWKGLERGLVQLAPFTEHVNAEAMRAESLYRHRLLTGDHEIWEGPIRDQQGNLRVPEGETLSDEDLFQIDWVVEGVQATIPEE